MPPARNRERLIAVAEVATIMGVSVRTVWRLAEVGELPAPVKLSPKVTRWKLSEIEAFIRDYQPAR